MKVSLITTTYNSAKTIREALLSVAAQKFEDLEYIIIDNSSQDGTLAIIEEFRTELGIRVISEPDNGLYDAMNKGIALASGEIIGILNSDDRFADHNTLKKIAACFRENDRLDAVYGDVVFIDPRGEKVRHWRAGEYEKKRLARGWTIPHLGFFARRDIYKQNPFRSGFELAGDYEFFLRLLKSHELILKYLPETLIVARTGGLSGRNFSQRLKGWREIRRAWLVNGLKIPPFLVTRRVISKIGQYFSR